MTKSFKMILLEAFIELDGFHHPPSEQALAERSWHILQRRPDLAAKDLPEKFNGKPKQADAASCAKLASAHTIAS